LKPASARIFLVFSRSAGASAHSGRSPSFRGQCLQAPALPRNLK
jgi:hypothetical protein